MKINVHMKPGDPDHLSMFKGWHSIIEPTTSE